LIVEGLVNQLGFGALALDGMGQRAPDLGRSQFGGDEVVLSALADGLRGDRFVLVGAERDNRGLGGRHPDVLEQRQSVLGGLGGFRGEVDQHAATRVIEKRLRGRRIHGRVGDHVDGAPRGVEQIVDQPRRAVIASQQQDPDRPCLDEIVQQSTPFASNSSTSLFKPAHHNYGS
jgi:hypothetical protein